MATRTSKKNHKFDFYESFADLSMATLGIFIIFFIINILFLNRDYFVESETKRKIAGERASLEHDLHQSNVETEVLTLTNNKNELELKEIRTINETLRGRVNHLRDELDILLSQKDIRELVSGADINNDINKILADINNESDALLEKNAKSTQAIAALKSQFNKYQPVGSASVFLSIMPYNGKVFLSNNRALTKYQFIAILKKLNMGSGFSFRLIKNQAISPEDINWLNQILISNGWYPLD